MWARRSSSKWHEVQEVAEYQVEMLYPRGRIRNYKKARHSTCSQIPLDGFGDHEGWFTRVAVRDTINIMQNNVCAYCRNAVLKKIGAQTSLMA